MKIFVLGYGSSGKAAEALARRLGYDVEVREDGRRGLETAAPGGGVSTGDAVSRPLHPGTPAFAVVSPGVPLTSPLVAECRRRGIPLKSELQFGCEELRRQGWKLLAVTGSKGKSSVVKVVADAINLAGGHAVACGNYGVPVCVVADEDARRGLKAAAPGEATSTGDAVSRPLRPWAVVEVSSFMMETTDLPSDTFEAAAILNLQEDHLDRHGSVEVYHGLKRKLLTMARHRVDAASLPREKEEASIFEVRGKDAASTLLGNDVASTRDAASTLWAGSYFDNEILSSNGAVAAELMRVAGLDDAQIATAFRTFVPLPHRMNLVAEIGGVRYIDDSKATSLSALAAGVVMASSSSKPETINQNPETRNLHPSVRLIAGGRAKGDDPKSVITTLTDGVKKVYLIGECAGVFLADWKVAVNCEVCGTLEKAVESARRDAEKGETVLLSPGTASYDQFQSFGERGDVFARLVKKERKDK